MQRAAHPGKVRLTAGQLKGRRIAVAPCGVRPTPLKARQALFNILGHDLSGHAFLDLYAGSGAVGLEAFSHGCAPVVLVEQDATQVQLVRRALAQMGLADSTGLGLMAMPVARALTLLARGGQRFDYIFVDPPYDVWDGLDHGDFSHRLLALLTDGGRVVMQRAAQQVLTGFAGLSGYDTRRYGSTSLDFFRATLTPGAAHA
jgi:16S rRNA (guanine966-N2)-methyltransferase